MILGAFVVGYLPERFRFLAEYRVLLFGAARIPALMKGVGEGMRDLRKVSREEDEPAPPAAPKPSEPWKRDVI